MTDNEIIKALEEYVKENEFEYFHNNMMCLYPLIKNALDLINRQKAEIERLQKENEQFADIGKMYSEIKTEAVKEFIKRFEKKIKDVKFTIGQWWEIKSALKEVEREMVGDNND